MDQCVHFLLQSLLPGVLPCNKSESEHLFQSLQFDVCGRGLLKQEESTAVLQGARKKWHAPRDSDEACYQVQSSTCWHATHITEYHREEKLSHYVSETFRVSSLFGKTRPASPWSPWRHYFLRGKLVPATSVASQRLSIIGFVGEKVGIHLSISDQWDNCNMWQNDLARPTARHHCHRLFYTHCWQSYWHLTQRAVVCFNWLGWVQLLHSGDTSWVGSACTHEGPVNIQSHQMICWWGAPCQ